MGLLPQKYNSIVRYRQVIFDYKLAEPSSQFPILAKACLAEFLGTFLFVYLATAVVTSGCHTRDVAAASGLGSNQALWNVAEGSCFLESTTLLNIALAFGFMLFVVIYFCASFSGGHINPAVTFGMFLTGKVTFLRGILYVISQCVGSIAGAALNKGIDVSGFRAAAGAANQVNRAGGFSVGTALGAEISLTFALVFTVFAATDTDRALSTAPLPILAPLSIGMVVFVCHLVAIPIDGCSINPARSLGPAVIAHQYHDFWLFWVGPFAGAAVASILYEIAFRTRRTEEPNPSVMPIDEKQTRRDIEAGKPPSALLSANEIHSGITGLNEKVRY